MASGEDEAPSWLSAAAAPTPTPTPTPAYEPSVPVAPATSITEPSSGLAPRPTAPPNPVSLETSSAEDESKLKNVIFSMRLFNLGVAASMITHAVLTVLTIPSLAQFVLAFYAISSGCLICSLESQLSFIRTPIAVNFGFLFDPPLRFLFYMIMASLEWSFGDLMGKIVAGVIFGCALYNTFVMFKFPKYRKKRDELAKLEDARIQQKIRSKVMAEAQKSATASIFGRD